MTLSLDIRLGDLVTAVATDIKQLKTWITGSSSGNLTGLTTTDKSNLIAAINEVKAGSSGAPPDATEAAKGIVELASLAEVAAGVDTVRAVTPQGVRQERTALKTEILGVGIPEALDTLAELAAALDEDENFAATVTEALANRVRVDDLMPGLTEQMQEYGRANIQAVAINDIGDFDADLVAQYVAAKA